MLIRIQRMHEVLIFYRLRAPQYYHGQVLNVDVYFLKLWHQHHNITQKAITHNVFSMLEMQRYTTSRYDTYHGISFMIRYVSRYTVLINKSNENNKTAQEYIQYIM
jgi:hypothetical protein